MLERRTKGSPERAGLKVPPPGSPALGVLYQLFKHVMAESLSDLNLPSFSGRRERRRREGEGRGTERGGGHQVCARAFSLPDGFSLRLRPRQTVRAWEPKEGGVGAVTSRPSSSRAGGERNLRETLCWDLPGCTSASRTERARGCVGTKRQRCPRGRTGAPLGHREAASERRSSGRCCGYR